MKISLAATVTVFLIGVSGCEDTKRNPKPKSTPVFVTPERSYPMKTAYQPAPTKR